MRFESLKKKLPEPIKKILRPVRNLLVNKKDSELSFWKSRHALDKGKFNNSHYERIMLAMSEEHNQEFLKGKIVADFGCGPRGSLAWANSALLRIGIDVLADVYADEFTDNIISHGMIYLKSTEKVIPLPSAFVDIMFTLNAIDHVNNFSAMCSEIIRVLKPGGIFMGSFNLEEPASPSEPQQLNESIIQEKLLNKMEIQCYRITAKGTGETYAPFFDGIIPYTQGQEGILWVKATRTI
ncbi:MAG: class I SAM-dependent methyltransferase [Candidatus Magnetominusculus sp. LBB02]|nr:class I SAM-dependent methyltransferase [Candidatus Magnetominusculus sp. LBB02]